MSSVHSRNHSKATSATSSFNMILEHVLQYPGSYEIPLRTMYTLNCNPRAQPLPRDSTRTSTTSGYSANSGSASPVSGQMAWNDTESSAMDFTSQLMNHIGSLPSQTNSLPPPFIISFVSRCFHPDLSLVDFPQALTALDYLRDLEKRRCKEFIAAFERLGINLENFEDDIEQVADKYPGVALWAKNMQGKNKKAETYYAHIYLTLRRWIMINELSIQPFNKLNCLAMLNTLLPPQSPSGNSVLPSPLLQASTLKEERDCFFEYIGRVQKRGPRVLQEIVMFGKGEKDANGWYPVQRSVDKYLRVAKNTIDDCLATTGIETFTPAEGERKGKKTDSGVSFGSERRPSTIDSTADKVLPNMPNEALQAHKGLSKLERITREFKRMRVKTRPDVEEIVKVERHAAVDQIPIPGDKSKKSLKKARSFANLGGLRAANASSTSLTSGSRKGSDAMGFDAEAMKRHRKLYDQTQAQKSAKHMA
ncbi:hypothetical protein BU24DRAFT_271274 [Aaosphaeria arxii CBS 175.79]|uniref:Uncharacterized protein n=1 Tax=Aaosphaeria arxii CBS 175.79 TaxID=1450172 RepID=A0A6A5XH52_9PLEO|nr:uncharacterized protein BU24DRAFT_271274 [Aaosphaeria arxii CBS 175.79]KAF2012167.1 hypothetical protein BU24DRAFT_271274 [Aaosphaeria arxii CBS 175.79]